MGDNHRIDRKHPVPVEYAVFYFECRRGTTFYVMPCDVRSMRYCPMCGESVEISRRRS